jgi:hypothetical protein
LLIAQLQSLASLELGGWPFTRPHAVADGPSGRALIVVPPVEVQA